MMRSEAERLLRIRIITSTPLILSIEIIDAIDRIIKQYDLYKRVIDLKYIHHCRRQVGDNTTKMSNY